MVGKVTQAKDTLEAVAAYYAFVTSPLYCGKLNGVHFKAGIGECSSVLWESLVSSVS